MLYHRRLRKFELGSWTDVKPQPTLHLASVSFRNRKVLNSGVVRHEGAELS